MREIVIVEELAVQEFERLADEMGIDVDTQTMGEEDAADFEKIKRRIVKAIMLGDLSLSDEGLPVYTPSNKRSTYTDPLTFNERTGATLTAIDKIKKDSYAAKTYLMMAEMCRVPQNTFAKLAGNDIKVCEDLFKLLMA